MAAAVESFVQKVVCTLGAIKKYRWLGFRAAAVAAPVLALMISAVPNRYEAKAQIYVDTETVLKPLMVGLTFEPDASQQVHMLARTLISRPNIIRLMELPELHLDDPDPNRREMTINRLMTRMKVVTAGADNFYEISYRGEDPEAAKKLVDATVNLFVQSGVGAKQRDSTDAGQFIDDQIRAYEEKLVSAENQLKDFKVRNFGATGVSAQDHFSRVSSLSEEVSKLQLELNAAEKARESYRQALTTEMLEAARNGSSSPDVIDIENRIEAQNKLLDEYLHRFTDHHPDVVNARRTIEDLRQELYRRKEMVLRGSSTSGKEARNAANPVYQKLRVSLAETEAQVASLRSQLSSRQATLDQARAVGGKMPQVEAELAQLNRDYDVIRKNYELLVSRREAAQLGVKLNASSQLAEFRVVEPPKVSKSPVFPSRLHLAFIAIFVVAALGVGVAAAAHMLRPSVVSIHELQQVTRRPVLGSVSLQAEPKVLAQQRLDTMRFARATGLLFVLQAAWIIWIAAVQ